MDIVSSFQFLLQKSWIKLKGGLFEKKRFAALCAPKSVQEIGELYQFIFDSSVQGELDESCIPSLGSIAYSAVKGTPFLILLDSETNTDKPVFVHLDSMIDIKDEEVLGVACSFEIDLGLRQLKIQCLTSIDYQNWIAAMDLAFQMVHSSKITAPQRHKSQSSVRLSNAIPLASTLPRRQRTPSYIYEIKGSNVEEEGEQQSFAEALPYVEHPVQPPSVVESAPKLPEKDC